MAYVSGLGIVDKRFGNLPFPARQRKSFVVLHLGVQNLLVVVDNTAFRTLTFQRDWVPCHKVRIVDHIDSLEAQNILLALN